MFGYHLKKRTQKWLQQDLRLLRTIDSSRKVRPEHLEGPLVAGCGHFAYIRFFKKWILSGQHFLPSQCMFTFLAKFGFNQLCDNKGLKHDMIDSWAEMYGRDFGADSGSKPLRFRPKLFFFLTVWEWRDATSIFICDWSDSTQAVMLFQSHTPDGRFL